MLGLLVLGMGLGAAAMHFGLRQPAFQAAEARIEQYEQDLAALQGRLDDAGAMVAALEGRLRVEESTRRGLEATLGTVQGELGRARDTLAFYEQLMPPGPDGAISVRALDIEREGPHLKYRMLLMRSGSNGKPFQGELQFLAQGRVNGEAVTVPLRPATAAPEAGHSAASAEALDVAGAPGANSVSGAREAGNADAANGTDGANGAGEVNGATAVTAPLAVAFSEFQRSSGLLGLPEGFEPESVTVNVLEGRTVRVSRSIELPVRR